MPRISKSAESRSQTVTFRTTPTLRFGIELVERRHAFSTTAALTYMVRKTLQQPLEGVSDGKGKTLTLEEVLDRTWHPSKALRFARLAMQFPDLLTEMERDMWEEVLATPAFWDDQGNLRESALESAWENLRKA